MNVTEAETSSQSVHHERAGNQLQREWPRPNVQVLIDPVPSPRRRRRGPLVLPLGVSTFAGGAVLGLESTTN